MWDTTSQCARLTHPATGQTWRDQAATRRSHDRATAHNYLRCPRPHYAAGDWAIKAAALQEIQAKRLPHKRAFLCDGILTELFAVSRDCRGYYTDFWGRVRYDWPPDVLGTLNGRRVASVAALEHYRRSYRHLRATAAGAEVVE